MSQQTKALGKSLFLFVTLLCFAGQAAPVTVLAPVVEVKGSASWSGRGSAKAGTLQAGETLAEGSAVRTGKDSRVLFAPVPGVAVSEARETSASLVRLAITRNGGAPQKRDVVLRLAPGTLSFSLEKRDATTTSFAVNTPSGTMNARGSVGTVTVVPPCVKVASLNGKITFTPSVGMATQTGVSTAAARNSPSLMPNPSTTSGGAPITVPPGCFLGVCGKGTNTKIRLINTINRTWTNFGADGTELSTRSATVEELASTRGFFETALSHASLALGYGLFSAAGAAEVTQTLTQINQSFATVGLTPVETPVVGSSSPARIASPEVTPGMSSFSGGSANPANTSGEVISREQ